jgi:hypothetical protein
MERDGVPIGVGATLEAIPYPLTEVHDAGEVLVLKRSNLTDADHAGQELGCVGSFKRQAVWYGADQFHWYLQNAC